MHVLHLGEHSQVANGAPSKYPQQSRTVANDCAERNFPCVRRCPDGSGLRASGLIDVPVFQLQGGHDCEEVTRWFDGYRFPEEHFEDRVVDERAGQRSTDRGNVVSIYGAEVVHPSNSTEVEKHGLQIWNTGGMPLDPAAQFVCELTSQMPAPWDMPTIAESRAAAKANPRERFVTSVDHIEDRKIPGPHGDIPVRMYRPDSDKPLPVVMYFHGGGWVICDLDTHDNVCRDIAFLANAIVVSVDYRMAPECKFPIPVDDCLAATKWTAANVASFGGDPTRIAVAGDSAGGNLATVVAMRIRDEGGPKIAFQGLIYPATGSPWDNRESYVRNGKGYFLSHEAMVWFTTHYMNSKDDTNNPYFAPLRASTLAGMPPAIVLTCEYDPLLDEGVAYGDALRAAGVACEQITYPGLIHAAFGMDDIMPASWQMQVDLGHALRQALHS